MSRVRIGHSPDAWLQEEPRPAHVRQNHYAVSAEVIGSMRPILTYGPVFHEARTLSQGWRKDSRRTR